MASMDQKQDQSLSPLKRALIAVKDMREKLAKAEGAQKEPIAIVGMACRFPGAARDIDGYWQVLRNGIDTVGEIPPERWDIEAYYDADPDAAGKMYTRQGGFIRDIDLFDAEFFGITPREAASMDPQQRVLLDTSWQALESAGVDPKGLKESPTGVFVGISTSEYIQIGLKQNDPDYIDAYTGTGGALSVAAGRLSYFLGLHGPAISLDTACSSSLVAIDLAIQYLRAGKCNLALAGGVNLMLSPEAMVYLCKVRALSPDGRCKSFDESADGYGRGEGCGMIVLKRLRDASADGDQVLAVIRGAAVNHDGHSSGLTAPNGAAQQAVIRAALEDAGLEADQIDYIEAHGTGTALGDPIEIRALESVFKHNPELLIGTAKTNIGHLESAAGVAAVIKVVLALQNGVIPPNLHCHRPSSRIDWEQIAMRVPTRPTPWPDRSALPTAGVSSFGFSGTNAHVILQAAPQDVPRASGVERTSHLLAVSAHGQGALKELATRYAAHLGADDPPDMADICHSAGAGRAHFNRRMAVVADKPEVFVQRLNAFVRGEPTAGLFQGQITEGQRPPKVAFLFTGQGSQYVGMGRLLYETQPAFRKILDGCDELFRPHREHSLLSVLYPQAGAESQAQKKLDQTEMAQPALFALQVALAQLWRSWGVAPSAVLGHSVGEYAAACVAGVLSLEDGLALIRERSRLMQALPAGGRMAAVFADAEGVAQYLAGFEDAVAIAALNGPSNTVISGAGREVDVILDRMKGAGIGCRVLNVSHAFHSPLMDPILDPFEAFASRIAYAAPRIKLVSNLSGRVADAEELGDGRRWRRHIRQPVRFESGITTLSELGIDLFIEIGPRPILLGMARLCLQDEPFTGLPTLRQGRDDWQQMLESLADLYVRGWKIDWHGFDRDYDRRKTPLPSYPFQRKRHWLPRADAVAAPPEARPDGYPGNRHPLVGERLQSPALKDIVFRSRVSTRWMKWLRDHNVFGLTVFPMAGFLEMAHWAAQAAFGSRPLELRQLSIEAPLILADDLFEMQVIISTGGGHVSDLAIFSTQSDGPGTDLQWQQHVSAQVHFVEGEAKLPAGDPMSLKALQARPGARRNVEQFYQGFYRRQLNYGEAFRTVTELRADEAESLGHIRLAAGLTAESGAYQLHPALLDGCLQILGGGLDAHDGDDRPKDVYLPTAIGRMRVWEPLGSSCWSHVRFAEGLKEGQGGIHCSVRIFAENGNIAAEIDQLTLKQADSGALQQIGDRQLDEWLYKIQWQPRTDPMDRAASSTHSNGRWLVFADRRGLGEQLAVQLRDNGVDCLTILPGGSYQADRDGHYRLDPGNASDFERFFDHLQEDESPPILGIVHLWGLDGGHPIADAGALEQALTLNCASVLWIVQQLSRISIAPAFKLFLVTSGVQPAGAAPSAAGFAQAPLWGMGRVVQREHPELGCTLVDLDPAHPEEGLEMLRADLTAGGAEDQLAYRGPVRFVVRLVRRQAMTSEHHHPLLPPRSEAWRLAIKQKGLLESLAFEAVTRKPPGPGEVEIQVLMSSLDFRDVLNALGMYPGEGIPLGSECVGRITSLGEGVSGHEIGDTVIALAGGCFGNYVCARADWLMAKPPGMSDRQAATLPIVFLTAYYGLIRLAGMKKGDRVLIHAAAGGVGMAAVQLAQWIGAEVYATAGSEEKQQLLRSMGVRHVMHSRRLDFADQIMDTTRGEGVDIVLNALTGDFIPKSLSVLAPGGRFIELGKAEIWSADQVAQVNPQCRYAAFDLSEIIIQTPALVDEMYGDILAGLQSQHLRPLPSHLFTYEDAIGAFRFMAQARHKGKVVLAPTFSKDGGHGEDLDRIRPEGVYLITGGLGGIGLEIARWLAEDGARHLILMGRSAPKAHALETIHLLEQEEVKVTVFQGDVSRAEDVQKLFADIDATGEKLYGIVHAAGVLDDGVLVEQQWPRFQAVMAPKAIGAWLLHHYSQEAPLDFFVLFSSVASILGTAGQGNYAGANAFMDALAHFRRAAGLKAVCINWGPWQDVGMTARQGAARRARLTAAGVDLIPPGQGKRVFSRLISEPDEAQVIAMPVKWPALLQSLGASGVPPLLEAVVSEHTPDSRRTHEAGGSSGLIEKLATAVRSERHEIMVAAVSEKVAKVMGVDAPALLDAKAPFSSLGLDSLMAVELRNELSAAVGRKLQVSVMYDYATIESLAGFLLSLIGEDAAGEETNGASSEDAAQKSPHENADEPPSEKWEEKSEELDAFSPDEVARLLAEKIASVNRMDGE